MTDIVAGDLSDPDVLARAMDGVDKVYYVGPALQPRERETGLAAVQHKIKRDIEEQLISSGMEFTILQPTNYMLRHRLRPAYAVAPGRCTAYMKRGCSAGSPRHSSSSRSGSSTLSELRMLKYNGPASLG